MTDEKKYLSYDEVKLLEEQSAIFRALVDHRKIYLRWIMRRSNPTFGVGFTIKPRSSK